MAPRKHGQAIAHTTGHSPEYYQQLEADLNILELTQRVYKDKSEDLLSTVKDFWYE